MKINVKTALRSDCFERFVQVYFNDELMQEVEDKNFYIEGVPFNEIEHILPGHIFNAKKTEEPCKEVSPDYKALYKEVANRLNSQQVVIEGYKRVIKDLLDI